MARVGEGATSQIPKRLSPAFGQCLTPRPSFAFRDQGPDMTIFDPHPLPPVNSRESFRNPLGLKVSELGEQAEDFLYQRSGVSPLPHALRPAPPGLFPGALVPRGRVPGSGLSPPAGLRLQPPQDPLRFSKPRRMWGWGMNRRKILGRKEKLKRNRISHHP